MDRKAPRSHYHGRLKGFVLNVLYNSYLISQSQHFRFGLIPIIILSSLFTRLIFFLYY